MATAVDDLLAPARRRITMAKGLAEAAAVFPVAAGGMVFAAALGWMLGASMSWWTFGLVAVVSALAVGVRARRARRLSDAAVARRIERAVGCDGELVSALEFVDDGNPFHRETLRRASVIASGVDLRLALPVPVDGNRLGVAAGASIVAVLLTLTTSASTGGSLTEDADRALIEEEALAIEELAEELRAPDDLGEPSQEDIELAERLQRLAGELRQSDNLDEAADVLEETSAALERDVSEGFLSEKAALQGLEQQLSRTPLIGLEGVANAAEQFEQAAGQIDSLSPDSLAQLAAQLSQLSQSQIVGNPGLSEALNRAVAALESGDAAGAADALSRAAGLQRQAAADVASSSALSEAANIAASAAERLDRAARGEGAGQQAQGNGQGQGQGQGQGSGQGQGAGQGQGQGGGQGQGSGGVAGGGGSGSISGVSPSGQSPSGQGGVGTPGPGELADPTSDVTLAEVFNPEAGPGEEVQVDLAGGSGDGEVVGQGDTATLDGASFVPYQEVLAQYLDAAALAVDDVTLPAELRGVVQAYFDQIAEGGR